MSKRKRYLAQARGLIEPEHQVHVLDRLSCRAFAEIVECGNDDQASVYLIQRKASTAARALAALLPHVPVVTDCRFGCDPDRPTTWCTECRERQINGESLPVELRPTPFINLPVSATEDRVVGTLDIEKAIQRGERHFEPGVLELVMDFIHQLMPTNVSEAKPLKNPGRCVAERF